MGKKEKNMSRKRRKNNFKKYQNRKKIQKRKEITELKNTGLEQWMQMLILMWVWSQCYYKVYKPISLTFCAIFVQNETVFMFFIALNLLTKILIFFATTHQCFFAVLIRSCLKPLIMTSKHIQSKNTNQKTAEEIQKNCS